MHPFLDYHLEQDVSLQEQNPLRRQQLGGVWCAQRDGNLKPKASSSISFQLTKQGLNA